MKELVSDKFVVGRINKGWFVGLCGKPIRIDEWKRFIKRVNKPKLNSAKNFSSTGE